MRADKKFDAILFDLDGTLIHLPQEEFSRGTTLLMAKVLSPALGIPEKVIAEGLIRGVEAMIRNDGSRGNYDAFFDAWEAATGASPECRAEADALFNAYYQNEFRSFKAITTENPFVPEVLSNARRLADRVILATLPVFPACAQEVRLSWIGLSPLDFDLVTDFSNCRFSKPDPRYFSDICAAFSLDPARCLMVGNDVCDDILPALSVGMSAYLVTDCLLNGHLPAPGAQRSSFAGFSAYLSSL